MIAEKLAALPRSLKVTVALLMPVLALLATAGIGLAINAAIIAQADWRADAERTLSRGAAAQSAMAEVDAALKALPSEGIWARLYSGDSSEANQAALLADLAKVLTLSEIHDPRIVAHPTTESRGLQVWGGSASFQANASQLYAVSQQLRALPRYVRVRDIKVQAPRTQGSGDEATFSVELRVEGFGALTKAAKAPQAAV